LYEKELCRKDGNTRKQAILPKAVNLEKTQNFALPCRFSHYVHKNHIPNICQTLKYYKTRDIKHHKIWDIKPLYYSKLYPELKTYETSIPERQKEIGFEYT
jgi:hypothetical protein